MKVLLWWPGASIAVTDVAAGLEYGLRAHGVDVTVYRTDVQLQAAGTYLTHLWRARGRRPEERPSIADQAYLSSVGVIERALRVESDWVISVSGMYQHPDVMPLLRRAGFKVGLVCTETPYDLAAELQLARLVDHVWTNERSTLTVFRTVNPCTTYLRHAWHPLVHGVAAEGDALVDVPSHDVVFVGTAFIERIKLLEAVNWQGIDLGLYGHWSLLGSRSPLRRFLRGREMPNARAAALYRRARIGLNLHRTSTRFGRDTRHIRRAESLNPRAYELAACGCFYVSDARAEVAEVFGDLLPTFSTPAELEALIRAWLREPVGRVRRAAALQMVVASETWETRAAQVLGDLQRHERQPRAASAAA